MVIMMIVIIIGNSIGIVSAIIIHLYHHFNIIIMRNSAGSRSNGRSTW